MLPKEILNKLYAREDVIQVPTNYQFTMIEAISEEMEETYGSAVYQSKLSNVSKSNSTNTTRKNSK